MQIPHQLPLNQLPSGVQRASGNQPPVNFGQPAEVFTPSTAAPPTEQKLQTRSGLKGTVRQDQRGVAMQATLPAGGGLLPMAVLLEGSTGGGWTARVGEEFKEPKPTQMGSDGRVYVQLEPGAPSVVFDPRNLDFGLAGGARPTPTGWQRDQMELIDQGGVRHYLFREEAKAVSQGVARTEFTEVKWDGQKWAAHRVVRTAGQAPADANDMAGQLAGGVRSYLNGPDNGEVEMGVRMNPDNSLTVTPPTLGQLASKNAVRLLFGDVVTPFMQKQKNEAFAGTFMPFSAMPQGALFPVLIGGQPSGNAPTVAPPPPLPQAPAQAPGMLEQMGIGGSGKKGGLMEQLGLDGLFGGKKQPEGPPQPVRPVAPPVQFGQTGQGPVAPVTFGQPTAPAAETQPPVQFGQTGQGPVAPVTFGQPTAPASETQAPVQFGQQQPQADPRQALRQRYPEVDEPRFQAAWTLSGGDPEKAEQILNQFGTG